MALRASGAAAETCDVRATGKQPNISATADNQVLCGNSLANQIDADGFSGITMYGRDGGDTLIGGPGGITAYAGPGDDLASGGTGDDFVSGGTGDDTLSGGDGSDELTGDDGNDTLNAGPTGDTLVGGTGDDVLNGGEGNDTLNAGLDNDTLSGNAGADRLSGGSETDTESGGDGNDVIVGGRGNDNLSGDADNDTFKGDAGADDMSGGDGIDLADYSKRKASQPVTVTIDDVDNDGTDQVDGSGANGSGLRQDNVRTDVENVNGGSGADDLTGQLTGVTSLLNGRGGDDSLNSQDTDVVDTVDGGSGTNHCTYDNTGTTGDIPINCQSASFHGMRVTSGCYTSDHTEQSIPVGFGPDVVIVKSNDAAGPAVERTSTMTGTKELDGSTGTAPNMITGLTATGFDIGTHSNVNKKDSVYCWTAFKGAAGHMKVGSYTGNNSGGASQSITGVGFSPEYVTVLSDAGDDPVQRMSGVARTYRYDADFGITNGVTSLDADGFTVGADPTVNKNNTRINYVAWNQVPGEMKTATYSGTGASHSITGVGFQPDYVNIHAANTGGAGQTAREGAQVSSALTAPASQLFTKTANESTGITALESDGFHVGTSVTVNSNTAPVATPYGYVAFKDQP